MNAAALREALCSTFCGDLAVHEVPGGLAVSATFEGSDGDRLGCLIERHGSRWRLSDDGGFLGDLEGYGVDVRKGGRAEFLARTLRTARAHVEPDSLQIVSDLDQPPVAKDVMGFLLALARAQDVAFWTKERVRSTFREDATRALRDLLDESADLEIAAPIDRRLTEFPADLVIRPRGTVSDGSVTAVFMVQTLDALQEALLLALELRAQGRRDVLVAALIEDGSLNMGSAKAVRAVNRIDTVSIYRDDEIEAVHKIARTAVPSLRVAA